MLLWGWLHLYWQPLTGILLGLVPYAYVIYRRGLHRQAISFIDPYLLMFGGLLIILSLYYIFPISQNYPKAWLYENTGYDMPTSAQGITLAEDVGFFGDGDQILYFTASASDIANMIKNGPSQKGFSKWVAGPIGKEAKLPQLPFGTNLTNAPEISNSSDVMFSRREYGPEEAPYENYMDIFINPHTDEVLIHESDS